MTKASSEVGLRLRAYNASGSKTWQLSEINGNAGVFTIRNATNAQNILNIDGVNQRVGVNNTSPDHKVSVFDAGYCGLELKSNRSTLLQITLVDFTSKLNPQMLLIFNL